jgi:hypothetical protein
MPKASLAGLAQPKSRSACVGARARDGVSGTNRTTRIAGRRDTIRKPPDELSLLTEIWQISHFGWVPEAAIRRGVIIAGSGDVSPGILAEVLGQLSERGWVEQRPSVAGIDEPEWRLTNQGRSAVPRR